MTLLALLGATWWARSKQRGDDAVVTDMIRDYVRLVLVSAMMSYGTRKILLMQFPPLDEFGLSKTFAESSPMGLLWRFMTVQFTGAACQAILDSSETQPVDLEIGYR